MTRILQVRRGTTAQHDNFTGMPGEITMDTDEKTLRIHDGSSAGGYDIARADLSNIDTDALATGASIYAESIPATFWDALFREYNLTQNIFAISTPCAITATPYIQYIFDTLPTFNLEQTITDAVLICQSPAAG